LVASRQSWSPDSSQLWREGNNGFLFPAKSVFFTSTDGCGCALVNHSNDQVQGLAEK
jgi:hypothetical protein